jgi:formylmethanofuran dehydrogenase subunit E
VANTVPDRANDSKRKPNKNTSCWNCGTEINEDEGYHLVGGSPVCPSCMEEHERGK